MNTRMMALAVVLTAAAMMPGCQSCREGDRKETPENVPVVPKALAGLEALPAEARVVIGVHVKALRDSWLVERAIAQMFRRDAGLKDRISELITACKLDPAKDLDSVIIGLVSNSEGSGKADPAGSSLGSDPGPGDEAVTVATGNFSEAELARCVGQSLEADGGALTVTMVEGRAHYRARSGSGSSGRDGGPSDSGPSGSDSGGTSVYFALAGPRTLVIATSAEWLGRAVGNGAKLATSEPMVALLRRVDQQVGLWAVGRADARISNRLVELTGGKVQSPPSAFFGQLDLEGGLRLVAGVEMISDSDAKSLISIVKDQLAWVALAFQDKGLGTLIGKLGVDSEGKTVYLRMSLSDEEVRQLLSQLDTSTGSPEPVQN